MTLGPDLYAWPRLLLHAWHFYLIVNAFQRIRRLTYLIQPHTAILNYMPRIIQPVNIARLETINFSRIVVAFLRANLFIQIFVVPSFSSLPLREALRPSGPVSKDSDLKFVNFDDKENKVRSCLLEYPPPPVSSFRWIRNDWFFKGRLYLSQLEASAQRGSLSKSADLYLSLVSKVIPIISNMFNNMLQ